MGKTTKTVWVVAAALVLVIAWLASVMYSRIPPSAAAALESFYRRDVAEDQLMDPLILAGPDVIPLLERDLLNPDMPRRRYAIGALGNIGEPAALPILLRIVQAGSEADYIRCDALSAVARIDRPAADQLIRATPSLERECHMWLDSGSSKRSYLKALLGWHDWCDLSYDDGADLVYNYYRDYDPTTGRYAQSDPMTVGEHALLESIIPAMMRRNGGSGIAPKLELNSYAYVLNNPVSRIDPTGADEEGGKGGGGDGLPEFECPLRAQFLLAFLPKYDTKIWYCIYDCNRSWPGSPDNVKTHIEWDVGTSEGCPESFPPKWIRIPGWWK